MAPLFSAFVTVPGVVLLLALAFAVARFFQPASVAIRIALVFVAGSAIGGGVTLVGLAFLVGATLSEPWQVIAYQASLAVGAFFGSVLLVVFCIKLRVLTLRIWTPPKSKKPDQ